MNCYHRKVVIDILDGILKFKTKMDTDGVDNGSKNISSKMLKIKNDIANTQAQASKLRRELEEMAKTPLDTSRSNALKEKIADIRAELRQAGKDYEDVVDTIRRLSTGPLSGKFDEKGFNARMAKSPEVKAAEERLDTLNAKLKKYEALLISAQKTEMRTTQADTGAYQEKQQRLNELNGRLGIYQAQLRETEQAEVSAAKGVKAFSKGTSSARNVCSILNKSLKNCVSMLGRVASAGITAARSGLSKASNGVKALVFHTKTANNHLKVLQNGFKKLRRMGLALIGIRGLMAGIRQMVSSALENNEKLKTQLTATKGVIGEMLTPAITFLANALQTVVSLADRVFQLFTGTSAIARYNAKQMKKMADEQNKAAKSAKKQKDSLASFDQLNVMQQDSSDSNSGADAAVTLKRIATPFDGFITRLTNLFKKGKFEALGQLIADKINKGMKSINWNKIRSTAKKWANNIASFLNGFIEKINWKLLGKTLANGYMTAIDFLYTFIKKLKWTKLGKSIADFLNGGIKNIEWDKVGQTLGSGITALLNLAYGFVSRFDWKNFGTSIHTFIKNAFESINWKTLRDVIILGVNGLVAAAIVAIGNPDFSLLGANTAQALINMLNGISWVDISQLFTTLITGALDFVDGFVLSIDWKTLGDKIVESFKKFFGKDGDGSNIISKMIQTFIDTVCGLLTTLDEITVSIDWENLGDEMAKNFTIDTSDNAWQNMLGRVCGNIVDAVLELINGFLSDNSTADKLADGVEALMKNVPWKKILIDTLSVLINVGSWLIQLAGDLIDKFCKGLATGFSDGEDDPELNQAIEGLGKAIGNLFITALEALCKILVNAIPNFVLGLGKTLVNLLAFPLKAVLGDEWYAGIENDLWGKNSLKVDIPVKFPRLASGTVVPANYGEFLSVLGDNKREPEVVSPLSTMKQAFLEAMQEAGGFGGNPSIQIISPNGEQLFKIVRSENQKYTNRAGHSAF